MPADASIYSMIRPQEKAPGPMDQYAQGLQLRHLLDSSELSGLQRQQLMRTMADEDAVRTVFSRLQPGQDVEAALPEVMKVNPKAGIALQNQLLDAKQKRGAIEKGEAELHGTRIKQLRDELAVVQDDAGLAAVREKAMKLYGPQVVANMPQTVNDPNFGPWREKQIMDAAALLKRIEPSYSVQDFGGTKGVVQSNPNATGGVTGLQDKTMSPGERATDARAAATLAETKAEHGRVAERAKAAAERDKFSQPFEVTGPDGKPKLAMQNKTTGEIVDASTRQVLPGVAPKPGEAAQKQQVGVHNTRAALTEYRNALKDFAMTDIASPDARARMGTVYNNALLQAKEAFNLGVLNGPDYMILQQVLTNPASLKGGITSKKALDAQAEKLDEIMGRIGQQITSTQAGTPAPTPAAPPKPTQAQIDAELRRRKVIP